MSGPNQSSFPLPPVIDSQNPYTKNSSLEILQHTQPNISTSGLQPGTSIPQSHPGIMNQPRPPQSTAPYGYQTSAMSYGHAQIHNYSHSPFGQSDDHKAYTGPELMSNKQDVNGSNLPSGDPPYPSGSKGPTLQISEKQNLVAIQNGPYANPASLQMKDVNIDQGSSILNTLPHMNGITSSNVIQAEFTTAKASSLSQWPSQIKIPPPPGHTQLPKQQIQISGSPITPSVGGQFGNLRTQSPLQAIDNKTVPNPSLVPSPVGLPLPYNSQNAVSSSPQVTPGTSQPPSARSSRNPSPISTQRYDYMEGQFSNKSSPSSSTTNLQNMVVSPNAGQFLPNYSSTTNSSNSYSQIPTSAPIGHYGFPQRSAPPTFSSQSPVTSQPVHNTSLPQGAPMALGSTSVRPRYLQPAAYNQSSSPMISQPGNIPPPPPPLTYNSSPQPQPHQMPSGLPEGPVGGVTGYDPQLHAKMAGMSVHSSFSRLWGNDSINLLQDRNILPAVPLEAPKPVLPQDKPNCSPKIFRSTLTKVPDSSSLLQKSRLPFGILIHPFRDVSNLPVIQCNTIVRCRNCRTYVNPFVTFVDQRRWKCNLCFRINDLPEEFLYDPITRSYGDPARRPEVKNATMEFIAPSDYMLRPPQPAVYLFLLDVSHGACEIGYLQTFCNILKENLDSLPGDSRTRVGFITYDGSIHFYNLAEGINQPHMLVVCDVEDVFLPSPDNLLVNLQESKALIQDLLEDLPKRFANNGDSNCCLGSALQVAYKLMSPVGGRITVIQTSLSNYGPGTVKNREDPNQRAAKDVTNVGPANDFYKKLALECSGQQVAVDMFLLCSQYVDIATISCISKFSSGSIQYYPGFHHQLCRFQVEKFAADLKRYITRRIGFEAVMRIRCTRGLAIHTFHGNFFVRSTDLLSLPNVNPDVGFGMQIAIEENLTECNSVCFQAAVLYTSSSGERRIRVHTLCLPVVSILNDVLGGADQETIIGLVSKMAVDRSIASSLSDARDALINVCIDLLGVFKQTLQSGQPGGTLMAPYSTRLIPLFVLALLKHVAFRTGVSTKLDERVFAMERMKTLPLTYLMKYIYPTLYPVHALDDKNGIHQDDDAVIPQPVVLQLSCEKIDRHGAYILDTFDIIYLFVGRAVNDHFCVNVLGVPNFSAIPENLMSLAELNTPESERLRNFVSWLQDQRPSHSPIKIIREDSNDRHSFLQYMLDDRTESLFSYYEFLQHLRQQISK